MCAASYDGEHVELTRCPDEVIALDRVDQEAFGLLSGNSFASPAERTLTALRLAARPKGAKRASRL